MSKITAVEKELKKNGSITNWDIVTKYYTTNPQKIIEHLRKKHGYDKITDKWESKKVVIDGDKEVIMWKRYYWNENATGKVKQLMSKSNDKILLEHLQAGNIVTTRTAPDELGIADVRAHIRNLRNAGYEIKDRWVYGLNRRGNKTSFKEYYMEVDNA